MLANQSAPCGLVNGQSDPVNAPWRAPLTHLTRHACPNARALPAIRSTRARTKGPDQATRAGTVYLVISQPPRVKHPQPLDLPARDRTVLHARTQRSHLRVISTVDLPLPRDPTAKIRYPFILWIATWLNRERPRPIGRLIFIVPACTWVLCENHRTHRRQLKFSHRVAAPQRDNARPCLYPDDLSSNQRGL